MTFDLDRCVGYITDNAMKNLSEAFGSRLKDSKVTRIQWIALYHIQRKGPISQRELSHLMNVQDSSAGRLIDRLERDGMVKRERNLSDRRLIMISLTEAGGILFDSVLPIGALYNQELVKNISEEDLKTFEKVLSQLVNNV